MSTELKLFSEKNKWQTSDKIFQEQRENLQINNIWNEKEKPNADTNVLKRYYRQIKMIWILNMYKVIGIHSKLKIILKCKQFHNHYRHFMGYLSSHKENFRSQWIYQEVLPSIPETNNFKC